MSRYWQTLPYLFWYSTSLDSTASGFTSRHFLVFCLHMLAKLCSFLIYNLCLLLAGLKHCQSDFAEKKKKRTQIVDPGGQEWRWDQILENKPIVLQVIYGACAIFRSSAWSFLQVCCSCFKQRNVAPSVIIQDSGESGSSGTQGDLIPDMSMQSLRAPTSCLGGLWVCYEILGLVKKCNLL